MNVLGSAQFLGGIVEQREVTLMFVLVSHFVSTTPEYLVVELYYILLKVKSKFRDQNDTTS